MAFRRASSPVKAEYDELSSPDPLATSSQLCDPPQSSPTRHRSRGPTPNYSRTSKQQTKVSALDLSPSKTITEQTLSPWRIRVTVEAEPEEEGQQQNEQLWPHTTTRTIKVPLRDASSPLASNTTDRRSSTSQSAKTNRRRSATPDRASRARRPSLTDLDAIVLGDDGDENEWTLKKNSPRKRRNSKSKSAHGKSNRSRRSSRATSFDIREDEDAGVVESGDAENHEETQSPELRQIDLNRVSVRARSASTKDKLPSADDFQLAPQPIQTKALESNRKASVNSVMTYPTPSPTASERGHSDELMRENPTNAESNSDCDEPFDTMIESEGFTMIDLDSIPSIKQLRSSPEHSQLHEGESANLVDQTRMSQKPVQQSFVKTPSMAYPNLPDEGDTSLDGSLPSSPPSISQQKSGQKPYSIAHLQIPSSTQVYRLRQVTPQSCSSPKLPSPPRPAPTKDRPTPNPVKAVEAGIALQGALTPDEHSSAHERDSGNQRYGGKDDLFDGFDSSTKRELRAGLRFGEELAKRQKDSPMTVLNSMQTKEPRLSSQPRTQVWRGENVVSNTPVSTAIYQPMLALKKDASSSTQHVLESDRENNTPVKVPNHQEQEWQRERDAVIRQANDAGTKNVVIVESDAEDDGPATHGGEHDIGDETDGDIWLAEAKNTSSPKEEAHEEGRPQFTDSERKQRERAREALEKPKRKLIPSPWKRGEHIDQDYGNVTSMLSADTSMSGLLWKDRPDDNDFRFGAGLLSRPEKMQYETQVFDRRRSGFVDDNHFLRQTRRLSPRHEPEFEDKPVEAEVLEECNLQWENAEDVIDEETRLLEAEKEAQATAVDPENAIDGHATRLHETSLEDVPEQDLSSSPQQTSDPQRIPVNFNDESAVSQSDESTIQEYRQRTSLSPSKERPGTPRSALKGARLSLGNDVWIDNADEEAGSRRVVWAKRSSCMNEHWEESSRSIRSALESEFDETSNAAETDEQHQHHQVVLDERQLGNKLREEPQNDAAPSSKGWFGWFRKTEMPKSTSVISSLDGANDDQSRNEEEGEYAPTSRHSSSNSTTEQRGNKQPTPSTFSTLSTSSRSSEVPSFLQPPSYPSDPRRDISIPLSTSGEFTNTHFKTLHIIYRKSQKPRFHAPRYPEEVRPQIRTLVNRKWSLEVDEGRTPLGEVFTFRVREMEGRVLERFMQEVEWGYHQNNLVSATRSEDGNLDEKRADGEEILSEVSWGWTVEQLAGWLGRIAVGEVVRAEEKQFTRGKQ